MCRNSDRGDRKALQGRAVLVNRASAKLFLPDRRDGAFTPNMGMIMPVLGMFSSSPRLDDGPSASHITSMALSRKKATTIALDPEDDRLLSRAARERGVSRSEFIRQHLALVLEQYRRHPKPRSAGTVRALTERGDERELFRAGR